MNHKINFTNAVYTIPCVRCGKNFTYVAEFNLCQMCNEESKISLRRYWIVPEGQHLDEHLFPVNSSENTLSLN